MTSEPTDYRNYCPSLTRRSDFNAFWEETLEILGQQDLAVRIQLQESRPNGLCLQWLSYESFGGATIQAYLLKWPDDKPRPLVIHTHGYIGQCDIMWPWAERGMHVLGFDIRGKGRSRSAIPVYSDDGFVLTGIESHRTSVLRGAVCDYVRAHEVALHLLNNEPASTVFFGTSFAGALAMMAAAITQVPDLLVAGVPSLGWAEGRRQLVQNGSGREINQYLLRHPEQTTQVMNALSYFDTMNFADLIECAALIGLGLRDDIVPAPTVYAIVNHLKCRHEIREFPVSHSSDPQEVLWESFDNEWLELATAGIPDSFGRN